MFQIWTSLSGFMYIIFHCFPKLWFALIVLAYTNLKCNIWIWACPSLSVSTFIGSQRLTVWGSHQTNWLIPTLKKNKKFQIQTHRLGLHITPHYWLPKTTVTVCGLFEKSWLIPTLKYIFWIQIWLPGSVHNLRLDFWLPKTNGQQFAFNKLAHTNFKYQIQTCLSGFVFNAILSAPKTKGLWFAKMNGLIPILNMIFRFQTCLSGSANNFIFISYQRLTACNHLKCFGSYQH